MTCHLKLNKYKFGHQEFHFVTDLWLCAKLCLTPTGVRHSIALSHDYVKLITLFLVNFSTFSKYCFSPDIYRHSGQPADLPGQLPHHHAVPQVPPTQTPPLTRRGGPQVHPRTHHVHDRRQHACQELHVHRQTGIFVPNRRETLRICHEPPGIGPIRGDDRGTGTDKEEEEEVYAAVVVRGGGLDPAVDNRARVGRVRHLLRNHVPGHQVQEVDHLDACILLHIHLLHTAHQGRVFQSSSSELFHP